MEGEALDHSLLSPLFIFFLIGAVVASYLFGRFQSVNQFIIQSKVESATVESDKFQVTNIKAEVNPKNINSCLYGTFHLKGFLTSNKGGVATYKWEGSENSTLSPTTITFEKAETKQIETDWQVFGPGERNVKLHILQPNNISSSELKFNLSCN